MGEENSALENFLDGDDDDDTNVVDEPQDGDIDDPVDPPEMEHDSIPAASGDTSSSSSTIIAEQVVEVNLTPGGVYPVIRVKQYDNGYQIRFKIYDGIVPLDLNNEKNKLSVSFQMTKSNGLEFSCGVTPVAATGQCIMWLSKDATDVAGDHFCELVVYNKSGRSIGTATMVMVVERAAIPKKGATVETSVINDIRSAIDLVERLSAYEANLDNLSASTVYSRTWVYGNSFGGQLSANDNPNFCSVWRSGYAVTVSFAVTCTDALTVAANNRAIIKNLPKARHRVYLSIPIIHFTYSSTYNKWVPNAIKGMCICTIRPATDDASAAAQLQTDGALNPTSVDVGDVLYGTFTYITSELT